MKKVEIYTTPYCGFCRMTKEVLDKKGVQYEEIDVSGGREEMIKRTGGPDSVPQIFVDGELLPGGNSGIQSLEQEGKLDKILEI